MLTTDCMVSELPDDKGSQIGGADMGSLGGGMGGMGGMM